MVINFLKHRKWMPLLGSILAYVLCLIQLASPVSALSNLQVQTLKSGVYYFNTSSGPCIVTTTIDLNGNDNIQKAFNYFVTKGLTPAQSAGIVGNLMQESGVNPTEQQDGSHSPYPKDGVGFGIAQWTYASRQKPLIKFANSQGKLATDLGVQLAFLWDELSGGTGYVGMPSPDALKYLKQTSTASDAAHQFEIYFEAAGIPNMKQRIANAQAVLARYGNSITVASSSGATSVAVTPINTCSGSSLVGQNSQYVDSFLVYSQYDPAWASYPYGTSTIAASGCGPTAMAMIITNLTGNHVTPDQTATYATSQNLYVPNEGSSWSIAPVLAKHWGLHATQIGANIGKITATLQNGGLVIVSGQGPLPFTSGGHYIVIRGVTKNGQWKIADSAHSNTSSQDWNPAQLLVHMNSGSVYAITK